MLTQSSEDIDDFIDGETESKDCLIVCYAL